MQKSDDVERARQLVEKARVAEQHEETAKAMGLYDDALAEFREDSLDPFLPEVLRWKGTLLRERGETESAYRCYTRSLEKATLIGSEGATAHALNCLGTIRSDEAIRRRRSASTHRRQNLPRELVTRDYSA
jgi:tetratricopeptide (TPR) repeat protein